MSGKRKDVLIATCGTSVLTNASEVKAEILGDRHYSQMTVEEGEEIKGRILERLASKDAKERCCGAELNSICYLIEEGVFSKKEVHLIVSDSIEGELAAEIIRELLPTKLGVERVNVVKIEDLNIGKEHTFAKKGSRNLASKVTQLICEKGAGNIILSPIGGLKALIIIVAMIGQVFGIPSYYLYENSAKIFEILPLPVSIDLDFFSRNLGLISELYMKGLMPKKEVASYLMAETKLKNIVEEEKIDGEAVLALSPLGIVGYEKLINENTEKLPRAASLSEKWTDLQYKNNEAHAEKVRQNKKFQNVIQKILETDYVTKVIMNYYNPKNKGDQIDIRKSGNETEGRVLKLKYNNNDGMVEVIICLTENDDSKVDAARIDLYNKINK